MAKKILVIEDDVLDAEVIKKAIESEGEMEVETASTGEDGLKKALEFKPDLVTLDLILPDISGFEVCRRLKSERSLAKTIVIILSVKDTLEDIKKAFHVNADDYIIKPPMPEYLVKKIKLYLGFGGSRATLL